MQHYTVGIVGGGMWGLSTAFQLAEMGLGDDVLVLERNTSLASETTAQSAGQVGQLRDDPLLAKAVGATLDLLGGFHERTGHDPGFVRCGSLHLALTEGRAEQFRQLKCLADGMGIPTEFVQPEFARQLAPEMTHSCVVSSLFVPNDGYVDARQCALAFAAAARSKGVQIECNQDVVQIVDGRAGRVRLMTSSQQYEVDQLILTTGPWARRIASHLGIAVAMYPIRLQQARTIGVAVSMHHPVVRVPDASCYLRPEQEGYLFGFFDPDPQPIDLERQANSFRTSDVRPEPALIVQAIQRLRPVFENLASLPIDMYRQGMISCTPDGKFVLGPVGENARIWLATGCGGTGIAACGAIGEWLARWVAEGNPGADLSAYQVTRFGDNANDLDWLRERARATSAAYYRLPANGHLSR